MARLRRRLPAKQVAERAGMSPMTLRNVERGESGVTIGAYLSVLQVLGMEEDFDLLAREDTLGRNLQDDRLLAKGGLRDRIRVASAFAPGNERMRRSVADAPSPRPDTATSEEQDPPGNAGFASSESLANLIRPSVTPPTRRR